ncbi:hypothetical protein CONCODRAFT_77169 [Conidiobolus coronatus NRRL 28638]|uniref:Uncharacterized protein n=1 Tax=Conidiobolus coronatus (strain ATCC 28846 / CBS 209.66 / NRRL 28638) TaxID=796925 RepID=A0A137PFK0_CONC2|nr:hypothetical protein CONCODRAFT_77169 [Conidiobolus coronatus NRRL 28638]|eukprot:KXN73779.1 hypothetical protein CONCODRAFT_77169 [Conidiobolus coronatus NRRL 28638]
MPKSPTELSLREILDRYSGDKELLKVILEAKCLEDKKIAAQETHMEERVKLENRKIEYEIMKQFKNHPLVQPPKVLFSDPNAKQNSNNNGQHQQSGVSGGGSQLPTLSSYLPTSAGTQISPSSQQFTPITPFNQHEGSNPDSPPHPRILSDVTIPRQKYSPTHNNNNTNNNRPQRPRINTNTFPYSRPETGGAPLTLSIYRTNNPSHQPTTTNASIKTISGMVHRHSRNDPIKSAPVRDRRDPANTLESSS